MNSDKWLVNKKGQNFLSFKERKIILESLEFVDEVIDFDDDEKGSCINALKNLKKRYPQDEIIFCNGGDRKKENIPEMRVKDIKFEFGIGGHNKENSSSWILKDWKYDSEERVWGSFNTLFLTFFPCNFKKAITEPEKVIAPTAAPIDISIKLPSLIFPGVPRLNASGFRKAEIATKTAAKPTRLWKPATLSLIHI